MIEESDLAMTPKFEKAQECQPEDVTIETGRQEDARQDDARQDDGRQDDGQREDEADNLCQNLNVPDFAVEGASLGKRRKAFFAFLLIFVNLLNYMDRNSVSSVLDPLKDYFSFNDTAAGLLRSLFILTYMIFVIVFGYLGDRYNRLMLISVGIGIWALVVLSAAFLTRQMFVLFVILRMMVGVGEGSFSTISPSIVTDMYEGKVRTIVLAVYNLMIPVGAGVCYVMYAFLAQWSGRWQTGFYVTPTLAVLSVVLMWIFVKKDPPRGKSEMDINGRSDSGVASFKSDLKIVIKTKTFILLTFGQTLQLFVVGALLFWIPDYIERSPIYAQSGWRPGDGSIYFGLTTMSGGVAGVLLGGIISFKIKMRSEKDSRASMAGDAYICGASSLCAAPLIYTALILSEYNISSSFFLTFLSVTSISTNWSVVMDACLYVIHPNRRSLAMGVQLFITKMFGEAWSSFVIGAISDACQRASPKKCHVGFYCLQHSMFLNCFVLIIGGYLSLCASWYIDRDKHEVDKLFRDSTSHGQMHQDTPLTDELKVAIVPEKTTAVAVTTESGRGGGGRGRGAKRRAISGAPS